MAAPQNISAIEEARTEFASKLERVLKDKKNFHPSVHQYITELMTHYFRHSTSPLEASINTKDADPFIVQLLLVNEQYGTDSSVLYLRNKAIGDTAFFAFARWPKSLVPRRHVERPSLDYFADAGSIAYHNAGRSAERTTLSMDVTDLMMRLSRGFNKYAGAAHVAFQQMGDLPETDVRILLELAKVFEDDSLLRIYDLRRQVELVQEEDKKIIFN